MVPKLLLLCLLVGSTLPASAAKAITVAQLNQVLSGTRGETDAKVAGQLSELKLTERLSTATLTRCAANLPGPESRRSLMVLADESAFLDPPAAEIPATPTPSLATQRQIIALAAAFAKKTISKLPDFFATRQTLRFADTPADFQDSSKIIYAPLHLVNSSQDTVLYRNGREEVDLNVAERKKYGLGEPGLSTSGVFGPILATVLMDTAQGTLAWGHWEQGPLGPQAVFRYAIPAEESHYEVELSGYFHDHPAYHGEFGVDPANGSILRLTLEAEMKPTDPVARSAILVEYGTIEIGNKSYICPVKSISVQIGPSVVTTSMLLNKVGSFQDANKSDLRQHMQTSLNDVVFEHYHVFRAEARILTAETAKSDGVSSVADSSEAQDNCLPAASEKLPEAVVSAANTSPLPVPSAQQQSPGALVQPAVPQKPATPPRSVSEPSAGKLPTPTFRVTSRIVYVDVVVHDSHGHTVHGLTQDDFKVSEDNHPQKIDFFRAVMHDSSATPVQSSPGAFAAGPVSATASAASMPVNTINMILFDLLDTSPTNQTYARSQMLKFLAALEPGHKIALFVLSGRELHMVQNFTGNSELLAEAARLLLPKSSQLFQSVDAERHGNDVSASMPGFSTPGGSDNSIIADLGEELSSENFQHGQARNEIVNRAFQKLAQITQAFNGRKNLFWLAESFPLGVLSTLQSFQDASAGLSANGPTSRMISESRIAVYPISVLGLQSDSINAEMHGNGTKAGVADLGADVDQQADSRMALRDQMQEIADQTGGEAFAGTNDIAGALRQSLEGGENYYSLVYTPTNKNWNGKSRKIEVKLAHRGYTLSYRRGYVALPEPSEPSGNTKQSMN